MHWTLHKSPWLYRTLHKKHHTNTSATRANDTVRLTMGEEVLDVGCSIIAVNALGAHPLSRAVYDVVIVWLLVELHCGYDFPWASHNVVPNGVSRFNSSPLRNTPMIRLTLLARLAITFTFLPITLLLLAVRSGVPTHFPSATHHQTHAACTVGQPDVLLRH